MKYEQRKFLGQDCWGNHKIFSSYEEMIDWMIRNSGKRFHYQECKFVSNDEKTDVFSPDSIMYLGTFTGCSENPSTDLLTPVYMTERAEVRYNDADLYPTAAEANVGNTLNTGKNNA